MSALSSSPLRPTTTFGPELAAVFAQSLSIGVIAGQMSTFWSLTASSGDALRGPSKDCSPSISHACSVSGGSGDRFTTRGKRIWHRLSSLPTERTVIRLVALYVGALTILHYTCTLTFIWHELVYNWGSFKDGLKPIWAGDISQMLVCRSFLLP